MEYASYLAGERWSDHPDCTHPLLAAVARGVNDNVSDASRHELVSLIPTVVGLNGDDLLIDLGIALRCASMALPVASQVRQRALAAGLLAGRRVLDDVDHDSGSMDIGKLTELTSDALSTAPNAARWAQGFAIDVRPSLRLFAHRSAPSIVRLSIFGIAEACISDRDSRLISVLTTVIEDCLQWMRPHGSQPTLGIDSTNQTSLARR
jgi:hypothetical protein